MLASTADSTWSSSRRAATEASLSMSADDSEAQAPSTGEDATTAGDSDGDDAAAAAAATVTAAGVAAAASEGSWAEALGAKKEEETIAVLRSRLSSSSSCFFSLMTLARSSDSVSMRPETRWNTLEDAVDWNLLGTVGINQVAKDQGRLKQAGTG